MPISQLEHPTMKLATANKQLTANQITVQVETSVNQIAMPHNPQVHPTT
jgi:hypothetical protein